MDFSRILVAAALVESLVETIKMLWQSGKFNASQALAIVIAVLICVLGNIDLLTLVGIPLGAKYAGPILSGIMISRGANGIHYIIDTVKGIKEQTK